jgi:hypothetical protein
MNSDEMISSSVLISFVIPAKPIKRFSLLKLLSEIAPGLRTSFE